VTAFRGRLEPGLVIGTSLGVTGVVAQGMLWLDLWQPKAFLYLFAALCVALLVVRLRSSRAMRPPVTAGPTPLEYLVRSVAARTSPGVIAHLGIIAAALAMWRISLTGADLGRIAGLGLVNALPLAYFAAFGALLVGFAGAVTRRPFAPALAFLYVVALVLVVHGTTPVLYDEPRYIWSYKHFGVINVIAATGHADRTLDIYNNWPGFFVVNAWLTKVTDIAPTSYAPWAQVFFNLANVAALQFALRGLTSDRRLLWIATWIFLLANWVGQDYLAPQAFAFLLSTVVIGLCLRCGRAGQVGPSAGRGARARLRRLLREDLPRWGPAPLPPVGAFVAGGLCYVAVLTSHQLTPVVLIASVTALALTTRGVPWWVPAGMAVLEVWWVALAWSYLRDTFGLFDPNPTARAVPEGYHSGDALPGVTTVTHASWVLVALVLIGAAVGLILRYRTGRHYVAVAGLIAAPLVVVGAQSYSGEGRYRLFLFALPFLSFLAATALAPAQLSKLPNLVRRAVPALVGAALGACLLLAYFGLELTNRVSRGDVDAAVWFERHAPPRSLLVVPTSNNVSRLTARYPRVYQTLTQLDLTDLAAYRRHVIRPRDLPGLAATLREYGGARIFVMITQAQEDYTRLYGTLPAGWDRSLERSLRGAPSFRLVYRRGSARIFEYSPARDDLASASAGRDRTPP
jgi:hypothetical protein